jgi:AcrR family transcriptional regulator
MPAPRDRYHHGDLRTAAVEAALAMIEGAGGREFTMRAVAETCGVAHRAVAAQFADRAGLEAAVAAAGFGQLCDQLADVGDTAGFLRTFTGFALANPALYDLMMRQPYPAFARDPALRAAADRMIAQSLAALAPQADNPTAARRQVMRFWMLVHGGVALHRSGILHGRDDAAFIAEMLAIAELDAAPAPLAQPLWHEQEGSTDDR